MARERTDSDRGVLGTRSDMLPVTRTQRVPIHTQVSDTTNKSYWDQVRLQGNAEALGRNVQAQHLLVCVELHPNQSCWDQVRLQRNAGALGRNVQAQPRLVSGDQGILGTANHSPRNCGGKARLRYRPENQKMNPEKTISFHL